MAEINSGIRAILSNPIIYEFLLSIIGVKRWRKKFISNYVKPLIGESFLDVGCGTGELVNFLPDVNYVGFDHNKAYIANANRQFGHKAKFICDDVSNFSKYNLEKFDVGVAIGLLHHLNDEEVVKVLKNIKDTMKTDSRFIIVEPYFCDNQSPVIRFILDMDRGQNIRYIDESLSLCQKVFQNIKINKESGHLPFPHALIYFECKN